MDNSDTSEPNPLEEDIQNDIEQYDRIFGKRKSIDADIENGNNIIYNDFYLHYEI